MAFRDILQNFGAAPQWYDAFFKNDAQRQQQTTPVATQQYAYPIGPNLKSQFSVFPGSASYSNPGQALPGGGALPLGGGGSVQASGRTTISTPVAQPQQPSFNFQNEADKLAAEAGKTRDQMTETELAGISDSYAPIFSELDRQLGGLGDVRSGMEDRASELYDFQRAGVESTKAGSLAQLGQEEVRQQDQSKKSLRELEGDIRNQLDARGRFFGNMGAGDSSAVGQASEAVSKVGMKARGNVLETRDQALTEIGGKRQEVERIAGDQFRQIDSWKSDKLFEISQFYQQQVDSLNQAKANATSEEKQALTQASRELQGDYLGRLRQLQDSTLNYKTSVDSWQRERAAQLEDFQMQLSASSKYGGGADADKNRKEALAFFNQQVGLSNGNVDYARSITAANYGIDPMQGYEIGEFGASADEFKDPFAVDYAKASSDAKVAAINRASGGGGFINDSVPVIGRF